MLAHPTAPPRANLRRFCALSCLSVFVLGAGQASALPGVQLEPSPGVVLVQAAKPGGQASPEQPGQGEAPAASTELADLNEVLAATQAKLEELFEATAALAERREAFEAIKQENERLAAALQQANTRGADLERSSERAEARIAELTEAVNVAVREAARIDEELAGLRRENAELEERIARADTARGSAEAEIEQTRTEMQAKLEAATGTAEQLRGEVADLREQLKRAGQQLAKAESAREQVAARATEMEKSAERSDAEAERLKAELAAVKEQLGQAATAAVEAERARQTASGEAEQLRGELERAREELAAAKSEVDRFSTANMELEKQVESLRADSQSAMEAARRNLVVMEEKIEELNAALAGAGLAETAPASKSQINPLPLADEPATATRSQSSMTQPSAPEGAGAGQRADGAPELAAVAPATAPSPDESPELAKFNANIQYLNRRAMDAAGADLFSGVEAAGDGVVHVSTTPAWENVPAAGQRSYLNSLLDLWIVAQEGSGPAIVRIVDPSGRVLLEKSGAVQDPPSD